MKGYLIFYFFSPNKFQIPQKTVVCVCVCVCSFQSSCSLCVFIYTPLLVLHGVTIPYILSDINFFPLALTRKKIIKVLNEGK